MSAEAKELLATAQGILEQRGKQYGDAECLFRQIAVRFSLVLGVPVTAYEAARLLAELKNARMDLADGYHKDSGIDAINYIAIAGAIADGKKTQKS